MTFRLFDQPQIPTCVVVLYSQDAKSQKIMEKFLDNYAFVKYDNEVEIVVRKEKSTRNEKIRFCYDMQLTLPSMICNGGVGLQRYPGIQKENPDILMVLLL